MSDQSKNAGNIGDIFKHSVLPELVLLWLRSNPEMSDPTYLETHAGSYRYPLHKLKKKNTDDWRGGRAWSLGVLAKAIQGGGFGVYGDALRSELDSGFYPGSMRLAELAAAYTDRDFSIAGFDLGPEQVESYREASGRGSVVQGDGYEGVDSVPCPRLIFCDPFWGRETALDDSRKCQELLEDSSPCIVWYPLMGTARAFREWLRDNQIPRAELRFIHYKAPSPWSTRDLKGSGIAYQGLPPELAAETISHVAQRLMGAFKGERQPHGDRHLDLGFSMNTE